jgi:uncharacterized protein YehS (DUF1456 family)
MIHNDVLRSVRFMLNLRDQKIVEILDLGDLEVDLETVKIFLKNEDDPEFEPCPDEVMAAFLDGLIYFRRGKDPARPPMQTDFPITNNTVLKKLRVAFELKEDDIVNLLQQAGFPVTATELSAFFRRKGHPNYRDCGDQYLRNVLKGLTQKLQKPA